jgi:hypothetical protein
MLMGCSTGNQVGLHLPTHMPGARQTYHLVIAAVHHQAICNRGLCRFKQWASVWHSKAL